MNRVPLALLLAALPLSAQAWDIRAEVPFPKGQSLPQTLLDGTGDLASGKLDTGRGGILTLSHRLLRVGPVLKFEWNLEYAQFQADGRLQVGSDQLGTDLRQRGVGLGLNAQFWIPFTGVAGELGVTQRFQRYTYEAGGLDVKEDLSRPWLRVGARVRLPFPVVKPYLAASYQEPLSKDRPVKLGTVSDLQALLQAQGSGQEFERLWTFGIGLQF